MCGIAGFIDKSHAGDAIWIEQTSLAMADSLIHRGPDDTDVWVDSEAGLGFGFRRLAIIDLSPAGRQPMISKCQRFVIIYNGETYNCKEQK
jgi:asparagine synthase (glutamine-hydrolysing)